MPKIDPCVESSRQRLDIAPTGKGRPGMNGQIQGAALALLMAVAGNMAATAAPVKGTEAMRAPDYANVKSRADAERLVSEGKLVKVALFPFELGGEDVEENITFIPPGAAEARALVVGTLVRFVREGLINKMEVLPEYRGDSIIPTRIVMQASRSSEPGSFAPTVHVW